MKIFWSWQSDTPGSIGRFFVRDALVVAIERLKNEPEIDEPTRDELQLDHDRLGVSGSPDLARTILEKIKNARVFVGDVTLIGATESGKPLVNSNVAIELGYALSALGDTAMLMVANEHYGSRDSLPFDLRHKAGPILFNLDPSASKAKIKEVRHELSVELANALKPYVVAQRPKGNATKSPAKQRFNRRLQRQNAGMFFAPHETLAKVGDATDGDLVELKVQEARGAFVRLSPIFALGAPIQRSALVAAMSSPPIMDPMLASFSSQALRMQNRYGCISLIPFKKNQIRALSQAFENGEIWGFNGHLLRERTGHGEVLIPVEPLISTIRNTALNYIDVACNSLKLSLPFLIEVGLVDIQDSVLSLPNGEKWGPVHAAEVLERLEIANGDVDEVNTLVNAFVESIFDKAGYPAPAYLLTRTSNSH